MSNLTLSAVLMIIDEATKPLKMIQNYSESSSDSITELDQSIKQLNSTLNRNDGQRYNQALKQTEKNTNAARTASRLLVTEYGHIDRALSSLLLKADQWNAKLAQSRQNMRQEFKNIAVGGVIAGAGLYKFFQPAIDFEKQVSGVQAVLNLEKTSEAMKQLEADARKWGAASSFSPTEAAQAQFALGSGGFNVDQIRQALGGTLQLAEAGKVELEQAAQIAVGTLNGFGLVASEITRVNDVFVQATNATATSVGGLGETMKYVAPVAKQYGASIEQVTAMTGLLGNNNILDTQAGTALRGIMLRLAAPPKAAQDALDRLGVKTADTKGNLRDLSDVMNDLRVKTSKMGSEERLALLSDISGTEAASAMAVLVDQTGMVDEKTGKVVNKIKQLTEELENSQGAAAEAAKILKDNLAGDIENMGGEWQDLSIAIQKVLGNDMRKFIQQVAEIIGRIKDWVEANPELVKTLANVAIKLLMLKVGLLGAKYTANLFLGGIVSIIAGITKFAIVMWVAHKIANKFGIGLPSRLTVISKSIQLLSRAFTFLARQAIPLVIAGLRALAIAALTNPLTLIIAAIIAVAFVIYRYWGPIKAFFQGFWSGLMIGLAPFKDSISSLFTTLKATLAPLKPVWDALVAVWTIFKGVLAEALGPFQATNQELANATSYGSTLGQVFGSVLGVIGELILIFVKLSMAILVNVGTAIGEFFGWLSLIPERASAAFNALKTYVKEAGATFINFLLTPLRLVIDAVNILISGMNKIPSINIPKIPQVPTFAPPAATIPTKKVTPTAPISVPNRAVQTTNHFMGAQITISGVNDPKQVALLVDQKLKQHQSALTAQQQRTYNDRD